MSTALSSDGQNGPGISSPQVSLSEPRSDVSIKARQYETKTRTLIEFLKGVGAMLLYALLQPLNGVCVVEALDNGFNPFELLGLGGMFGVLMIISIDFGSIYKEKYFDPYFFTSRMAGNDATEISPLLGLSNNDRNNESTTNTSTKNQTNKPQMSLKSNASNASNASNISNISKHDESGADISIETQERLESPDLFYLFNPFGGRNAKITLILIGFAKFFAILLLYYGYQLLDLGNAITLRSATTIFAIFIEAFILKSKEIHLRHWIVCILTVFGVIFMAQPTSIFGSTSDSDSDDSNDIEDTESQALKILGYCCGLGTSLFTAVGSALFKILVKLEGNGMADLNIDKKFHRKQTMLGMYALFIFRMLLGIFGSLIFFDGEFLSSNKIDSSDKYLDLYIVGVITIGPIVQASMYYGLHYLLITEAKLIRTTDVVWGFILGVLVFSEIPDYWDVLGVCLIVIPVSSLNIHAIIGARKRDQEIRRYEKENQENQNN